MPENQEKNDGNRAAVYIDGFNLYHPIHEMNENFLKWNCLWSLSESLCHHNELTLVKVVFCTAVPAHMPDKRDRHNTFNRAQAARGVTVIKGHHVFEPDNHKYTEKQSDINVALSLMSDAEDGVFDWAFLLSADSDQAATARVFSERHPDKKLVAVAPPNRKVPQKSKPFIEAGFSLTKDRIEACVMPQMVESPAGGFIRRPDAYAPPDWWMHPNDRPKK